MERRYPENPTDDFRISHSSLQTFLWCPRRYRYQQEEHEQRRATIPMMIGTAVAAAAELDAEFKAAGERRRFASTLVERAVFEYDLERERCDSGATPLALAAAVDEVASATMAFHRDISPSITNPILAEKAIIATIAPGIELAGRPDLIEPLVVRDLKTGQPWTQARANKSRQLTGYDLLHEARYGQPARRVAIDTVGRTARGWSGTTLWSYRTERDREAFVETVTCAVRAIKAGVDTPAPESAWYCSDDHCEFWKTCTARPGP